MATATGSLTTTGATSAGSCVINNLNRETLTIFQVSGTYGTVTYLIEGSKDGTNYATVISYDGTLSAATSTITPADNATKLHIVPSAMYPWVRLRLTAIGSGAVNVIAESDSNVGVPALGSVNSGNTLTGTTLGGTTTVTGNIVGQTQVLSADGAITIKTGTVYITKGTAAAITIAAPTATTDDGCRLMVESTTAAAHTVTNTTPGFNNGGAASDKATFGAAIGNGFEFGAYQGVWYVLNTPVGVTLG